MCNISVYELPSPRNSKIYEAREKPEGKVGAKESARQQVEWVSRALGMEGGVVVCGGVSQTVLAEEELRKFSYQKWAQSSPDRKKGSRG